MSIIHVLKVTTGTSKNDKQWKRVTFIDGKTLYVKGAFCPVSYKIDNPSEDHISKVLGNLPTLDVEFNSDGNIVDAEG